MTNPSKRPGFMPLPEDVSFSELELQLIAHIRAPVGSAKDIHKNLMDILVSSESLSAFTRAGSKALSFGPMYEGDKRTRPKDG